MNPFRPKLSPAHKPRAQSGAALMIMLIIIIIGTAVFLVTSLSKVTMSLERGKASSDMLAQAKEIVIGYAVNGTVAGERPGNLPFPDRLATPSEPNNGNYDGDPDGCPGLMGCLGRLPWRRLGMSIDSPSENDASGRMPWYAVSANMVDPTGVTFNSELLNSAPHPWLTIRDMNGNPLKDSAGNNLRVAFIVFIPGPPINGQTRPTSPNLKGASEYLDSITVAPGCTLPCVQGTYSNANADEDFIMGEEHRWIDDPANPGKQIEDPTYHFNDKLLYVTIDELMPLIEKRIAREAKNCLDTYAASSAEKYPWAAPITDPSYATTPDTLFGRIPSTPVFLVSDPALSAPLNDLQAALNDLQAAVNACNISDTTTNRTNLTNAANALLAAKNGLTTPPFTSSSSLTSLINASNNASNAALPTGSGGSTYSSPCDYIKDHSSSVIETNLNAISSNNYIADIPTVSPEDPAMQASWPAGCFVAGTYWDEWQHLVLYQLSDGFKPGTATPVCGTSCLSINGSGNPDSGSGSYRAAIAIAGKKLTGQTRTTESVDQYLEANNKTNKTATPSNLTFDTYRPTDAGYSSVNDLVLCLDGKVNCK